MANEKRQQQKKKERERRKATELERRRTDRAHQESLRKKAFGPTEPTREKLRAEILLAMLGCESDSQSRGEANRLFQQLDEVDDTHKDFCRWLDDLFASAQGKVRQDLTASISPEQATRRTIASMRKALNRLQKQVSGVHNSVLGQRLWQTENISDKLTEATEARRQDIVEHSRKEAALYDKHLGNFHGEGEDISNDPDMQQASDDCAVDFFMRTVTDAVDEIRAWQMGVPSDFYAQIVGLAEEISTSAMCFFLRSVYENIAAKASGHILAQKNALGLVRLGSYLKYVPESLPDHDFLRAEAEIARSLHALRGGEHAIRALEILHEQGESYASAIAKLARLGSGVGVFQTAVELASAATQSPSIMLSLCCEHPTFIAAAEALRSCCQTEVAAEFLFKSGDYQLGNRSLADVICSLRHRPSAMKLLVENALYFCCGDGAQEMADLLADMEKATKALRAYIRLCQSEAVYKQMALLRYLRLRGVNGGYERFMECLDQLAEEGVFEALACNEDEIFIGQVLRPASSSVSAAAMFRPSALDLVARYNLAPELVGVSELVLRAINESLEAVRASRYEAVLLGQARLRQRFFERLRTDAAGVIARVRELPAEGNPYLYLKAWLFPAPDIPKIAPEVPVQVVNRFSRILLVSARATSVATSFLEAATNTPVQLLSPDAATCRFDGISADDLVIYDTAQTSHAAYYRIKNMVIRRSAAFRHASQVNRQALVDLVLERS